VVWPCSVFEFERSDDYLTVTKITCGVEDSGRTGDDVGLDFTPAIHGMKSSNSLGLAADKLQLRTSSRDHDQFLMPMHQELARRLKTFVIPHHLFDVARSCNHSTSRLPGDATGNVVSRWTSRFIEGFVRASCHLRISE